MYLQLSNISKTYGLHPVLNSVSLVLNAGERIGLVGVNGAGKTTLLRIITGEVAADAGTVTLADGMRVGYLAQAISAFDGQTLADLIADSMSRLTALEARMRALETDMARGDNLDAVLAEYGDIAEQFERSGGYDMDYRVDAVLGGLGVAHLERMRPVSTLSGGEKSRVGMAMLLLQAPDVLLLDEPTNHLDIHSLTWLEGYLQAYRGAMLIVSHDRAFLNRTVSAIVEIDEHTRAAKHYAGNYDSYLTAKRRERLKWAQDYARQQDELKALRLAMKETAHQNNNYRAHTDNDKFVRNGKKATHDATVSKRVNAVEEKLRRLEENLIPEPPDDLRFDADFTPETLKGRAPLFASGLTKAYGGRCVLDDVGFTLDPGSRVVLVGANGAGKSTLLKLLAGHESPDSGEVRIAGGVKLGYLAQEQGRFSPAHTVYEAYRAGLTVSDQQAKAMLLKSGLFRYAEFEHRVGALSSGQERKLQLARLIADGANLLVLDEPTNHISFDVLEALESALAVFPGPVIAASHDRRFIERFGGEVWEVRDGRLVQHTDGFAGYIAAQAGVVAV